MRDATKAKARRDELKAYIETVKKNGACHICGNDDYRVLEFHHINPAEKKFSIVQSVHNRYSLVALKSEIQKCVLTCSNCHMILHYDEKQT